LGRQQKSAARKGDLAFAEFLEVKALVGYGEAAA
jgi:hypothetical protein